MHKRIVNYLCKLLPHQNVYTLSMLLVIQQIHSLAQYTRDFVKKGRIFMRKSHIFAKYVPEKL